MSSVVKIWICVVLVSLCFLLYLSLMIGPICFPQFFLEHYPSPSALSTIVKHGDRKSRSDALEYLEYNFLDDDVVIQSLREICNSNQITDEEREDVIRVLYLYKHRAAHFYCENIYQVTSMDELDAYNNFGEYFDEDDWSIQRIKLYYTVNDYDIDIAVAYGEKYFDLMVKTASGSERVYVDDVVEHLYELYTHALDFGDVNISRTSFRKKFSSIMGMTYGIVDYDDIRYAILLEVDFKKACALILSSNWNDVMCRQIESYLYHDMLKEKDLIYLKNRLGKLVEYLEGPWWYPESHMPCISLMAEFERRAAPQVGSFLSDQHINELEGFLDVGCSDRLLKDLSILYANIPNRKLVLEKLQEIYEDYKDDRDESMIANQAQRMIKCLNGATQEFDDFE